MYSLSHGLIKLPKHYRVKWKSGWKNEVVDKSPVPEGISFLKHRFISLRAILHQYTNSQTTSLSIAVKQESHTPHFEINLFWRN